ncbi:DUF5011 domain-containing protein [Hyalangium rubrum]|uniref:DUF5011 domain-containing protein n=1 Tax=Hyalangium rubrum TaxID=3103134 RepID=A0ABU5GUQ0_9BACT|nr:DUF5011 domain-containing protein [Hyalangium sp. s54d21]MDY7224901.1 DUF5011 domain-containing protein [Hyalangium sp. s54d21]
MRLGLHPNHGLGWLPRALMGGSLLLAVACGGELPPEEVADLSTLSSELDSCSPDVTPPVIFCQPEAGTRECLGYGYIIQESDLSSLPRDNCGIGYVNRDPVNTPGAGTYRTGVSAQDMAGNSAGCSTSWSIIDTQPPSITLRGPAQLLLPYGSPYVEQGATGNDSCDIYGANYPIRISGSVDPHMPGTYPITYTLSDRAGHVTRRTRLVTVLPQDSCTEQLAGPVLALQGHSQETLECGRNAWNDPGALAADACGAVTVQSYNSGHDEYGPGPNTSVEGNYTVQYLAWNGQGTTSALRTVTVRDTVPPTLRLQGEMYMRHTCGSAWVEPGYRADDSCYGNVSYSVQVSGNVNGWAAGRYTLTYEARDPGGRRSNLQKRIVDVVNCPW